MHGANAFREMLISAANSVLDNVDLFTKLDSEIGDGDHGVTMEKISRLILKEVTSWTEDSNVKENLDDLQWKLMSVSGGSAGPL